MSISLGDIFKWRLLRRGDSAAGGGGATSSDPLVLGRGANSNERGAVAVGFEANASGLGAVALGERANAYYECIGIGKYADARNSNSVAIGSFADAYGWNGATAIGKSVKTYDGIAIGRDVQPTFEVDGFNGTSIVIGVNNSISAVNDVTLIGSNEAVTLNHAFLAVASNKLEATKVRLAIIAGATQQTSYLTLQHVDQLTGVATGRKISLTKFFALLDANGAEPFDAFGEGTSDYGYYS